MKALWDGGRHAASASVLHACLQLQHTHPPPSILLPALPLSLAQDFKEAMVQYRARLSAIVRYAAALLPEQALMTAQQRLDTAVAAASPGSGGPQGFSPLRMPAPCRAPHTASQPLVLLLMAAPPRLMPLTLCLSHTCHLPSPCCSPCQAPRWRMRAACSSLPYTLPSRHSKPCGTAACRSSRPSCKVGLGVARVKGA